VDPSACGDDGGVGVVLVAELPRANDVTAWGEPSHGKAAKRVGPDPRRERGHSKHSTRKWATGIAVGDFALDAARRIRSHAHVGRRVGGGTHWLEGRAISTGASRNQGNNEDQRA